MRRRVAARLACALTACLALAACSSASGDEDAARPAPLPSHLVFADEFDGSTGALPDPANWSIVQMADASGAEQQCYTASPDNVSTDGLGHLVIAAQAQSGNCADGWYRDVTSGRITTQGLHSWKYGRIEMRARVPDGIGTWPSFWAMGDVPDPYNAWPRSGEMDVMETVGKDPDDLIGTIHMPARDASRPQSFLQAKTDASEPLSSGFHTYGMVWDHDGMTWYLDGKSYGSVSRAAAERDGEWVFDRPFFLILNLAIGGVLGGQVPEDLHYPQDLTVDWVRVYQ